jgi:hypothetical protein
VSIGARLSSVARRMAGREPEPEVCVVSYPKCGRTWLRVLVGKALCEQFGLDERQLFKTLELSRAAKILPTKFVHDGTGGVAGVKWYEQEMDKSRFAGKKVALLVRDPRDVVVSSYFQAAKRMHAYAGSIHEFTRDECFGIRTIVAMYGAWQDSRQVPRDFLLLRYEDMHRDPAACLRSLLAFMGLEHPKEQAIAAAVRYGGFENMRRLESTGSFERKLRPGDPEDPESYQVRKGVVGGYADYLSPEDIRYVERACREAGSPFGAGLPAKPEPIPRR